jgi:hypothetical protein
MCCHCGTRLSLWDDQFWLDPDDNVVCVECAEALGLVVCGHCGRIHSKNNVIYSDDDHIYYCRDCYNRLVR